LKQRKSYLKVDSYLLFFLFYLFSSKAFNPQVENARGIRRILYQLRGMWLKRLRIFLRRYFIAIFYLLTPIAITALAVFLTRSSANRANANANENTNAYNKKTSLDLTLLSYAKEQDLVYKINTNNSELKKQVNDAFRDYYMNADKNKSSIRLTELDGGNETSIGDYVLVKRKENYKNLLNNYFGAIELKIRDQNESGLYLDAQLYYSSMAYHSMGVILNELNGFMLSYYAQNSQKSIRTVNIPVLGDTEQQFDYIDFYDPNLETCNEFLPYSLLDYMCAVCVAALISFASIYMIREKTNGSKQLQLMSDTHFITYWLANYLFDMLVYLIDVALIVITLYVATLIRNDSNTEAYVIAQADGNIFVLLAYTLINSLSWPLLTYIWSFLFKSDIIGFVVLFILLNLITMLDFIASITFLSFKSAKFDGIEVTIVEIVRIAFALLFPNIQLKKVVYNLKIRENQRCINTLNIILQLNMSKNESFISLNDPGIGKYLLFSLLVLIISGFVLFLIEFLKRLNYTIMTKAKSTLINKNGSNQVRNKRFESIFIG
jgi:hypothetical protein